mmetsp:Transcript_4075/g.7130  ORF Transcript_4075/g.7130 Transcript_4075/m.7130 type:complete len:313 (+) Transcript_4075:62-1000(+)
MKHVLITGSNSGLGLDTAIVLATTPGVEKITLAVRSQAKGEEAIAKITAKTKQPASMFEVLILQIGDFKDAKEAASRLKTPVDGLMLNAGGMFGGLTKTSGVVTMFAVNTIGHAIFVEELIAQGKVIEGAHVVFVGSFASRGYPALGLKGAFFPEPTADSIDAYIKGEVESMKTPEQIYGFAKGLMVLYASALARKEPRYKFFTVSPGSCIGTNGSKTAPLYIRIALQILGPVIFVPLGLMQKTRAGTLRFVDALQNEEYLTGSFLASAKDKATGKMYDNRPFYPQYSDMSFQEAAYEAVHRYIEPSDQVSR